MSKFGITALILLTFDVAVAQIANTATMDSADYEVKGKVTVEGYVDTYYAYNFNAPDLGDQPYFVSMSRHNEFNVNLAFVDVKYSSSKVRARVVPGFGTYMNMNYSQEIGSLKNLIEANAGVKLFKQKAIWLDVGILGSPYTNESAISKDHLAYTRSLAAENVPYYLSGAKLTLPLSTKVNCYLYLVNGWQQIHDKNRSKSFGSQLEFRPTQNILLNLNTYVGKEAAAKDSVEGLRYFSDLYLIYSKNKFTMTSCIYYGIQRHDQLDLAWWQANVITRYSFTQALSGSFRVEYFSDEHGVLVLPISVAESFKTVGMSVGLNLKIEQNILFRTEVRNLVASEEIFIRNGEPTTSSLTLTGSLCASF